MKQTVKISLDLETVSLENNAGILSIGATIFHTEGMGANDFYEKIDFNSLDQTKFDVSQSTLDWWKTQNETVRNEAFSGTLPIYQVLQSFVEWVGVVTFSGVLTPQIFSNGSVFDIVVLRNALDACDIKVPWSYKNEFCYRTICNMHEESCALANNSITNEVKHNALADAKYQALVLEFIFKDLEDKGIRLWKK